MANLNKQILANLSGKMAVLYVGGETEASYRDWEKKFRIDDALQATQAAVRGGISPGGGLS